MYNIFVLQKVPRSKISDDVTACDLWFAPSPTTKNPGYANGCTAQLTFRKYSLKASFEFNAYHTLQKSEFGIFESLDVFYHPLTFTLSCEFLYQLDLK